MAKRKPTKKYAPIRISAYVEARALVLQDDQDYTFLMATIGEVEKLALSLSEKQRAILAAQLLGSLPPVLHDDDEGMAEAGRRDAELEADPSLAIR